MTAPGGHAPGTRAPTDPLAVVAATAGVLSIPLLAVCLLGAVTGVVAVACGLISRGRQRRAASEGSQLGGGRWAVVGIATGAGAVVLGVLLLVALARSTVG